MSELNDKVEELQSKSAALTDDAKMSEVIEVFKISVEVNHLYQARVRELERLTGFQGQLDNECIHGMSLEHSCNACSDFFGNPDSRRVMQHD